MKKQKELLKKFILKKVKESVTVERPYFIVKWSGLFELCRSMNEDLLDIIDTMDREGLIRKALIRTKSGKKILAITLPELSISNKNKQLLKEFLDFVKDNE